MTQIAYASNLKLDSLKEYLDFLIKQGAIEERTIDSENSIFAITQQGITLIKFFWQPELSLNEKEK
jgi:predicted transcriptional regulator